MRHETEDFCDQKLASFEIVLERTLKTVGAGRAKLQAMPLLRGDEEEDDEDDDDLADQLFDQDLPGPGATAPCGWGWPSCWGTPANVARCRPRPPLPTSGCRRR